LPWTTGLLRRLGWETTAELDLVGAFHVGDTLRIESTGERVRVTHVDMLGGKLTVKRLP
jgi:hypothetical protein